MKIRKLIAELLMHNPNVDVFIKHNKQGPFDFSVYKVKGDDNKIVIVTDPYPLGGSDEG